MAQVLNLLYCYAPEDQPWLETIEAHLQELKRHCHIISGNDRDTSKSGHTSAIRRLSCEQKPLQKILRQGYSANLSDFALSQAKLLG